MSYDDHEAIAEFAREQSIPYTLLSDVESEVIERYGILNTEISKDDAVIHGIPFPGVYVTDEDGRVTAKFFHDSYKKRDSADTLIDAALGHIELSHDAPAVSGGDDAIKLTVAVHGGDGSIRQGVIRKLVARFELGEHLHIYGDPVPDGMVATSVTVSGPPGLRTLEPEFPPTEPLHLAAMGLDLHVFSGTVDIVVPFYATGELASETRPLDVDSIDIDVQIRYQACTEDECLLPKTETVTLTLPLDVVDVPNLSMHTGHGQREGGYDSTPAMRRLFLRKFRRNPLGLPKFIWKTIKLERAARRRANESKQHP